jgi:hypothetical protein
MASIFMNLVIIQMVRIFLEFQIVSNMIPWIPEPSVNNKLKRREGSGSTGGFFD